MGDVFSMEILKEEVGGEVTKGGGTTGFYLRCVPNRRRWATEMVMNARTVMGQMRFKRTRNVKRFFG